MSNLASPRGTKRSLAIAAAAVVLAVAVTWLFVNREVAGPRAAIGPAPAVALLALLRSRDGGALAEGATLSSRMWLGARIEVGAPCKVSLVHINVGHGMEALALNVPVAAGVQELAVDGGAVQLTLEGLSGPQRLTAVAALRELTLDEALSAGRGLVPPAVGVAAASFVVGP